MLRFFQFAGQQDRRSLGIDLYGMRERLRFGKAEDLFQHFDHVIVSVIVVIKQDNVI